MNSIVPLTVFISLTRKCIVFSILTWHYLQLEIINLISLVKNSRLNSLTQHISLSFKEIEQCSQEILNCISYIKPLEVHQFRFYILRNSCDHQKVYLPVGTFTFFNVVCKCDFHLEHGYHLICS